MVLEKLNGPSNAVYTSPEIQNSLLNIMSRLVQDTVARGQFQQERLQSLVEFRSPKLAFQGVWNVLNE